MVVGVNSDTRKPIITLSLTVLRLLRLDDTYDSDVNQATPMARQVLLFGSS